MTSRLFAAALTAAVLVTPAAFAQQEGTGSIACERDARELHDYFNKNWTNLTAAQQRDVRQRLDVIDSQCRSQPLLGQTNITSLRNDLRNDVQQQATLPEQGYYPAGE